MFDDMLRLIADSENISFEEATDRLISWVDTTIDFMDVLKQIGTIPESIEHDSSAEKLFSKASDAVLARSFREIGLHATVLTTRADSADVLVKSPIHGYSLVADSKAFRLSRTAKNQKDFKITALSGWRKDCDFAVLCSPYFQYPAKASQIYAQALNHNVCLFSWEHLLFLISNGIKESERLSFARVWNCCDEIAHETFVSDKKRCIIPRITEILLSEAAIHEEVFNKILASQKHVIALRSGMEISYWKNEITNIQNYTREQAINELIRVKKIREKIKQISAYAEALNR